MDTHPDSERQDARGKLDALRDAVQNPTAPHSPDESLAEMFASWADRFTV